MAALMLDGPPALRPSIELSGIPRSRAPSYFSTRSGSSVFRDDNEEQFLIDHGGVPSTLGKDPPAVRITSQSSGVDSKLKNKYTGWRFGVAVAACTALVVLTVNLLLAIVVGAKFHKTNVYGVFTAYEGDCQVVDTWATVLHILINLLSSALLSASNYTMQALSSPTRTELDRAHAKGDYLDIGVQSVRNLCGRISWRRTAMWLALVLSSVPIHLLYNSAVFKSLDSNTYSALLVNHDWLSGTAVLNQTSTVLDMQIYFANNLKNSSRVENLTLHDCITAYGTQFVAHRNNLLVVTNTSATVPNLLTGQQVLDIFLSYAWMCTDIYPTYLLGNCDTSVVKALAANNTWTIEGQTVDYCLSQVAQPHCRLQWSLYILIAVILMNASKAVCMGLTLLAQRESTLVTLGDCISSFLNTPDEQTRGRCLMSRADVKRGPLRWLKQGLREPNTGPLPQEFHPKARKRWFAAVSVTPWLFTLAPCFLAMGASIFLFKFGWNSIIFQLQGGSPFSLGFGRVDPRAFLSPLPTQSEAGLTRNVLLANTPQLICSFLYLGFNACYTSMLLASEWSSYSVRSKRGLRVTSPRGNQQSKYYLQLPYRYSVALILTSSLLHWLISESFFFVRIDVWQNGRLILEQSGSLVGYSCLPILLVILVGVAMLVSLFATGFRRLESQMPVAASCSVAIAAACHRPPDDIDAAFLPVSWGEVAQGSALEVGHACFTSHAAGKLIPRRLYA